MPQLEFGNPLLTAQVVWGAIIFVLFYLAVSRIGLPRVGAVLEQRATRIATDLEQARLAKETADRSVAELNEARRLAYSESQRAIADAVAKAKAEADARGAEINARLDKQLADSERQIAEARTRAMGSLREIATETASAVVTHLTGKQPDSGVLDQEVGHVIAVRAAHAA